MGLLIAGLLLWCAVHLSSAVASSLRTRLVAGMGLRPYRACFALLIIIAIVLMVIGWRAVDPAAIYQPPAWGRDAAFVLVFFTFILFIAAKRQTNIKRLLRHPQLSGVMLWGIGHLLANGDNRSLILFAGIGLWALLEILFINRRTGIWVKPAPVPVYRDIITVIIGVVVYLVLLTLHPYLSGAALI
jgi:uncharacterized membrane protein